MLAAALALGSVAVHSTALDAPTGIALVGEASHVLQSQVRGYLQVKLANLARIDPADPLADENAEQTLSLFGREDLIAAISADYQPNHCQALATHVDPLSEIVRRGRQTSIVIINESHARSDHRGFIADVARALRSIGYDTLAIETLVNNAPDLKPAYRAPFILRPQLPYFSDDDGFYLAEAGFGRLGREAKALGYQLLPYEMVFTGPPSANVSRAQQIAEREEAQASTLATFVKAHPNAKLLVHVGYHHALEIPTAEGDTWMAARLKAKTGIDPLTISQTTCRGGGDTTHLAELPDDLPKGSFDLVVDHPTARFVQGRPAWRVAAGDEPVAIPASLRPTTGWRVIEARPVGEPDASVPMDRVAIRPGDTVALMLPPGRYALRVIDVGRSTEPAEPAS